MICIISGAIVTNYISDVYAHSQVLDNRHCVIIDAGHGGIDGGAISCTGIAESQINLEIALRLNDLCQLLGMNTKMIRAEDVSIYKTGNTIAARKVSDLKERVRIVNSTKNAILLSIHQNYFPDSRYCGAQVFYSGEDYALASLIQDYLVKTVNISSKRKVKKTNAIYIMNHINCPAALIECGFLSNPKEEYRLRMDKYQKKLCCVIGAATSYFIQTLSTA